MSAIKAGRIPFMLLAAASLIAGVVTGLARIGWNDLSVPGIQYHGSIMVGGFLGTLIALEKVIPLKKRFVYIIPILSGLSVVFAFNDLAVVSFILLAAAGLGLTVVFLLYLLREKSLIYVVMVAGAMCWTIGTLMLLSKAFYPLAVPWWIGFVLCVITAERLELMKFLPVTQRQKYILIALLLAYILGSAMGFHGYGSVICGAAVVLCALWLLRFDLVRITINKKHLVRFVAVALLSGYIALLLAGIFMINFGTQAFAYDITVHTFFIGFAFSMIFAHGPVILPGVIGTHVKPYHPILYLWLALLHMSWLLRIAGGLALEPEWRKFSGLLSTIAILAYLVTLVILTSRKLKEEAELKKITAARHLTKVMPSADAHR